MRRRQLLAGAAVLIAAVAHQEAGAAECPGSVDPSRHEEDPDTLEFSLLQTSLQMMHDLPQRPETGFEPTALPRLSSGVAAPLAMAMGQSSPPPPGPAAWQLFGESLLGLLLESPLSGAEAAVRRLQGPRDDGNDAPGAGPPRSALVDMLAPGGKSDTGPHLTGSVPMILIFMLAFVIGVVFVVQVVSIALEDRKDPDQVAVSAHIPFGKPRQDRYSMHPWQLPSERDTSARGSFAPHSPMAPDPTPLGQEYFGRSGSLPLGNPTGSFDDPGAGLSRRATDSSLEARSPDAICPALILPHGEAQFSIPVESIRKLSMGQYPVEILGPSGRPLLHARLPTTPVGGAGGDVAGGRWLELSTTPTSRYPHACVGPLQLMGDPGRQQAVEIRGPRGDSYGTLEPSGGGWRAIKTEAGQRGRTVLFIDIGSQGYTLRASGASGDTIASAFYRRLADVVAESRTPEALRVQVNPGVDALLTLLCMLAVVLMSPGLTGLQ